MYQFFNVGAEWGLEVDDACSWPSSSRAYVGMAMYIVGTFQCYSMVMRSELRYESVPRRPESDSEAVEKKTATFQM